MYNKMFRVISTDEMKAMNLKRMYEIQARGRKARAEKKKEEKK